MDDDDDEGPVVDVRSGGSGKFGGRLFGCVVLTDNCRLVGAAVALGSAKDGRGSG